MSESYRPSNSTSGMYFFDQWCHRCSKDAHMSTGKDWDSCEPDEICSIIGDSMAYDIDDPKYPKAWVYKDGKPCCTEFVEYKPDEPKPRITEQERAAQIPLFGA